MSKSGVELIMSLGDDQTENFEFKFYNRNTDDKKREPENTLGFRVISFKPISKNTFKMSFRYDFNQEFPKLLNDFNYDIEMNLLHTKTCEILGTWEFTNCTILKSAPQILNYKNSFKTFSFSEPLKPLIMDVLFQTDFEFFDF